MLSAVTDSVVAWGDNGYGKTNVPPTVTNVVAISGRTGSLPCAEAGWKHCGLGGNYAGQRMFQPTLRMSSQ